MKKIAMIFTGGTIGMEANENLNAAIPALKGEDIIKNLPVLDDYAQLEIINFSQLPGPHIKPSIMLELKKTVDNLLNKNDYDGVIITHGTDSLEETAYFLDITLSSSKPIVITGSMQNISELTWDGASNLVASIFTAISDLSQNKGVLVVMNNEIHTAFEVTKTHTFALNSFQSPNFGPLGTVDHDKVTFYYSIARKQHIPISKIEPSVDLVKCLVGMDDKIIRFLIDKGTKGLVLEGMGRGNIPPEMIPGVHYANKFDIPVVIVSRSLMGEVKDSYGYEGGSKNLKDLGVILGGSLSGQKARIKLMIALGANKSYKDIKEIFESHDYIEI